MKRCSIVIPAYNEGENLSLVLQRIIEFVKLEFECFVVVDSPEDSSIAIVNQMARVDKRITVLVNQLGVGPAYAIRTGIINSDSNTVVVTMADGSDDSRDIEELVLLVERGVDVACASRYMPTGQQIGAPFLKGMISRVAGQSLYLIANVGTRDATNSFKAYSKRFLNSVVIESKYGFEMGIELVAKAHRKKYLVAEVPTIWIERNNGNSRFQLLKWIPRYLKWYLVAIGFRRVK